MQTTNHGLLDQTKANIQNGFSDQELSHLSSLVDHFYDVVDRNSDKGVSKVAFNTGIASRLDLPTCRIDTLFEIFWYENTILRSVHSSIQGNTDTRLSTDDFMVVMGNVTSDSQLQSVINCMVMCISHLEPSSPEIELFKIQSQQTHYSKGTNLSQSIISVINKVTNNGQLNAVASCVDQIIEDNEEALVYAHLVPINTAIHNKRTLI